MAGDTIVWPDGLKFEELPLPTACSACKTSTVAEVSGQLGRPTVLLAPHGGVGIGSVHRQTTATFDEGIVSILTKTPIKRVPVGAEIS